MKKSNFLKTVLGVATAMLMTGNVIGQVEDSDYELYDADRLAPDSVDYVTFKTGGTTMGYYAVPDPVYHPNYNVAGSWNITNGFTWNWTNPTHPGTAVTFTPASPVPDTNYVRITYPMLGNYVINVAERAPASFGSCEDATPTVMNVTLINPPTGTAAINPGVLWQEITLNQAYQICGPQVAQTVSVAFNEAVPNHMGSYAFQVTETIELLDGTGGVIATPQAETVIQDFPLAGKLKGSNLGTLPAAAFTTATPVFTYSFASDALAIQQNAGIDARTRYTYKVTRTGAAAQNGFASAISHKSDYISGTVNYYNFTNQTVYFIVNPTPATGTIYYIPNDFNY